MNILWPALTLGLIAALLVEKISHTPRVRRRKVALRWSVLPIVALFIASALARPMIAGDRPVGPGNPEGFNPAEFASIAAAPYRLAWDLGHTHPITALVVISAAWLAYFAHYWHNRKHATTGLSAAPAPVPARLQLLPTPKARAVPAHGRSASTHAA